MRTRILLFALTWAASTDLFFSSARLPFSRGLFKPCHIIRHPWLFQLRGGAPNNEDDEMPSSTPIEYDNGTTPSFEAVDEPSPSPIISDANRNKNEEPNEDDLLLETDSGNNAHSTSEKRERSRRARHTSNIIEDLCQRSSVCDENESFEIRNLITERANEYLEDLRDAVEAEQDKLPHPKKLLHYLASKVPAIKHSPDISLRVHVSRSDVSVGVSACVISTLGQVCEAYDDEMRKRATGTRPISAAPDLTTDRRFEQLVECILSGVNIEKRLREHLSQKRTERLEEDIETILDEESVVEDNGLKVRDACRAAWGLSVLGVHHLESIGGEKVKDILLSLSLRTRELLLARLQTLRRSDLFAETQEEASSTTEDRISERAEELAEDSLVAIWGFACVKACTGVRSTSLVETSCAILVQEPFSLRKKAQEITEDSEVLNVGSNDVIDRLAQSEMSLSDKKNENQFGLSDHDNSPVLLDWLTPGEIGDILWAIALHESNGVAGFQGNSFLPETINLLQTHAFERVLKWLRRDIENMVENDPKGPTTIEIDLGHETATVEVVDAALLLAPQEESTEDVLLSEAHDDKALEEDTTHTYDQKDSYGNSQTTDAVEELAREQQGLENLGDTYESIVEVLDSGNAPLLETRSDESSVAFIQEPKSPEFFIPAEGERGEEKSTLLLSSSLSPRDLSSIAWAVTELQDPLQVPIVALVAEAFFFFGTPGLARLGGGDLSNLAWAMARYLDLLPGTDRANSKVLPIIQWIVHNSLEQISGAGVDSIDVAMSMLNVFQPPEIGRLMWSIASSLSTYTPMSEEIRTDAKIGILASSALLVAASNPSMFATEDLMRITWAFTELCGKSSGTLEVSLAIILGQMIEVFEESLYRWEQGSEADPYTTADESTANEDSSFFSSFFGKPRNVMRCLDQQALDHEGDDDLSLSSHFDKPRSTPMLKDLPIDPSTLCRVACGYARLSHGRLYREGSWKLVRTAMMLMSSKSARLMREGSIHDITRLCEAAVLCSATEQGRELVVGLFVRKVLQVLNNVLDPESESEVPFSLRLSSATPVEITFLLWALGELGAKYAPSQTERSTAHRKMRLVISTPFLSSEQIQSLDTSSVVRLLRGLASMKFYKDDVDFVHDVLMEARNRSERMSDGPMVCDLVEAIASLKVAFRFAGKRPTKDEDDTLPNESEGSSDSENINGDDGEEKRNKSTQAEEITPITKSKSSEEISIEEKILLTCNELLRLFSALSEGAIQFWETKEIRRMLSVYSMLGFQADEFIQATEVEVNRRIDQLKLSQNLGNVCSMVQQATSTSLSVNEAFFGDSNEESRFESIKNGLRSIFWSPDADEADNEHSLPKELQTLVHQSAKSSSDALLKLDSMESATSIPADSVVQQIEENVAFEIGRCQELINNYRLIDFETGRVSSRFDIKKQTDMAKRMLSRLLP